MKKIAVHLMVFACLLFFALPALAQIVNPLGNTTSFSALFAKIISGLAGVVATVGVTMLVIAGIFYMTSAGSPERIGVAKKTLTYAIIGIALGAGYSAIIGLIQSLKSNSLITMLNNIQSQAIGVVGAICATMIIVAGIFYLTSAGSQERMKVARNALVYTVVGTAIALGATLIYQAIYFMVHP